MVAAAARVVAPAALSRMSASTRPPWAPQSLDEEVEAALDFQMYMLPLTLIFSPAARARVESSKGLLAQPDQLSQFPDSSTATVKATTKDKQQQRQQYCSSGSSSSGSGSSGSSSSGSSSSGSSSSGSSSSGSRGLDGQRDERTKG